MPETLRVGVQAEAPGSYHELAARLFFPDVPLELIYLPTFKSLYDAHEGRNGQTQNYPDGLDYIVAAEQSTAMKRWVTRSTDQLFRPDREIQAHRRAWVPVPLGLVASRPHVSLDTVRRAQKPKWSIRERRVHVHVQEEALEQCEVLLENVLPGAEIVHANDGAGAVNTIRKKHSGIHLAIAGPEAAQANGGYYMGEQLNAADAATSFLLISRGGALNQRATKSLIVVNPHENQAGSLGRIYNEFADRGIDLSHINSEPTTVGRFRFILEANAGAHTSEMQDALRAIQENGDNTKIVGSVDEIFAPGVTLPSLRDAA